MDLRERLNSYITRIDHSFALSNYEYVMEQVRDDNIKNIYKTLGPFDHYQGREMDEEDDSTRSAPRLEWDYRKSGA